MKLTKKDKLAISNLLGAGQRLSNVAFNLGQQSADYAAPCKETCANWDKRYAEAKTALRKLQLPP